MAGHKNHRTALWLLAMIVLMVGVSFASVPLYSWFCRVTGFDGTTQVAKIAPVQIGERKFTVRLNSDVYNTLPWSFQPSQRAVQLRVGEVGNVSFHVQNNGTDPIVGTSTYNVTPELAGVYFNKLQCFCFTKHLLKPGESADFPVQFFIDPAIMQDANLKDVDTITLSYTFFPAKDQSVVSQNQPNPQIQ